MDAFVYFWVWDKRFSLFLNIDHSTNRLSNIWLIPLVISLALTGYAAVQYWMGPQKIGEGQCFDQELHNLLAYFFGLQTLNTVMLLIQVIRAFKEKGTHILKGKGVAYTPHDYW